MGRRSGGVEDWRGGVGWRRGSTLPGSCGQAVAHTQLKRGREPELPRALEKTAEMGGMRASASGIVACTAHALNPRMHSCTEDFDTFRARPPR
mmetsp:Transcript_33550/g.75937  ORF Transcript_33550/g.75937 Transcript_33550/m.75937 type:complete len:93 (-) Transcript_33550:12-290(-)